MKEEEKIIKNTIKRTKEYDRTLSPYACKTSECQKLRKEESEHEEFDIRWPFEEDIDRILYCKSYQRYTDKTQALSCDSPPGAQSRNCDPLSPWYPRLSLLR